MNNKVEDELGSIVVLILPLLVECIVILLHMNNYISTNELTTIIAIVLILPHVVYALLNLINTTILYSNNRRYGITYNIDKSKLLFKEYCTAWTFDILSTVQSFTFFIALVYAIAPN